MFGAVLVFFGQFFSEVSTSLEKVIFAKEKVSYRFFGFIHSFTGAMMFAVLAIIGGHALTLSLASLPTFGIRMFLEILQFEASIRAGARADRTTFGAIRVITIPLLLCIDIFLGYILTPLQIFGMLVTMLALGIYFFGEKFKKDGALLALFTAINAAFLVSLFKYDTTYYNPIAVEQYFIFIGLLIYFSINVAREWWRKTLVMPPLRKLSADLISTNVASGLVSFAYSYGPASLILSFIRSSSVFWSFVSGMTYFGEAKTLRKILCCVLLVVAIMLMLI